MSGRVGVPGKGERVCPRCKGAGLINRRISAYPGYPRCERCESTGVIPDRDRGSAPAQRNIISKARDDEAGKSQERTDR